MQVEQSGLKEVCREKEELLAAKELDILSIDIALSDGKQHVSSLNE